MYQPLYRARQLALSLNATPLRTEEEEFVRRVLNREQAALFFKLARFEMRHALRVCRTLCAGGFGSDRELLQAALLHDLGKLDLKSGRRVPLWGKVANVVLCTVGGERLVRRLAHPDPGNWRYVFWLQAEHERRGAELAQQAGSSERMVKLIGHYPGRDEAAAKALKWADDLN